jgi:beta-glucosidase
MNCTTLTGRRAAFAILLTLAAAALAGGGRAETVPLYKNPGAALEARVNDLFGRLTQDEKLSLLTGTGFTTQPIPRLDVPAMAMVDAGQGVRGGMESTLGPATLFPSGVAMASTWNPELIGRVARAIGVETLNKGTGAQVLLGPAINIHRSPLGGRNGEYFSEDPFLASRLTVSYVRGLQSTGAAACIKHFAANNEEQDRMDVDVRVSERALREIYLPAFEAGVKEGHAWTAMAAYNKINGPYATANRYLITDVMKNEWGWDGLMMSDWGAVHETAAVINAGNDLEMPGPGWLAPAKVAPELAKGLVSQAAIDDSVRRILRTVVRVGLLDGPRPIVHTLVDSPAHRKLTFEAASEGIVLLKNAGGLLPLSRKHIKSIAVIGRGATELQMGAAGSPSVEPAYSVQPLDGIRKRAGNGIAVNYARGAGAAAPIPSSALRTPDGAPGLKGEYFTNRNLEGQPALTRTDPDVQFNWGVGGAAPGVGPNGFSVRWTGKLIAPVTGRYTLTLSADDGYRMFVDGERVIDHWVSDAENAQSHSLDLEAGRAYDVRVEYYQAGGLAVARLNWSVPGVPPYADAVEAARKSDVAVVFVTTNGTESEGRDRPSMALPNEQDALIQAVAAANRKTVVVLNNGAPVLMTGWLKQTRALIEAWFPGETGGDAVAAVLFGDANPSGKLPDTLAARREDYPDYGNFPGTNGVVNYAEDIYVGYRHFDKKRIAPLFPFGHGLSYTTFEFSNARLSSPSLSPDGTVTVSVDIKNTGDRAGAEVVQLYVHDPKPRITKAVRELKGFQKVALAPGETKTVSIALSPRALAYYDTDGKQWKADAGAYEIEIGASSRDIRLRAPLRLKAGYTSPVN